MKYHVKPASPANHKHKLSLLLQSPLIKVISISVLFGIGVLITIVGIGYLTSQSLPAVPKDVSKTVVSPVVSQTELKKVVAEAVPTQMPGCFCFGNNKCYPDGCERKPLQGETLQWEAICRNDFCGGRPYGMCYDSNSSAVNQHLCLSQPSCCEEMLRHDEPGGRGNPEACCWPERGYCHPYYCDQMTRPEQCGWYWQYHAGASENGYGCTQGTGPTDLAPIYGLPYFLLSTTPAPANTNTPVPTRTPTTTRAPTLTSTTTPTPTPTLTLTQTPTLTSTVTASPTSTPQSGASATPNLTPVLSTPTIAPGQPTYTTAPGRPVSTSAPGQPTFTIAPGQPTNASVPRCDGSCGICGWKDSAGICHSTGTLGNTTQTCCYHTCVSQSCTVVSGYGVDRCSNNENCQTNQTSSAPQISTTLTQAITQSKPPVSGDNHWILYLLVPIAIIIGAIAL